MRKRPSKTNGAPAFHLSWFVAMAALLLNGAIFGFFYSDVGLDNADPRTAIEAMAMNEAVRNAMFAPAFFGAPIVLGAAALIYLGGAFIVTVMRNAPRNQALAQPQRLSSLNKPCGSGATTIASAAALVLAGVGIAAWSGAQPSA